MVYFNSSKNSTTEFQLMNVHLPETFHKNKCSVHHQFIIIEIGFHSILANKISNLNKTLSFGRANASEKI